jgi:DNA-directed RNA polymerase subunit RPC12/RpoP
MTIYIILIALVLLIGGYIGFRVFKKDNPELRIFQKHYSCSVCGSEFDETLDFCPECAKERKTTVMLHEFFVEIKPDKKKLGLT